MDARPSGRAASPGGRRRPHPHEHLHHARRSGGGAGARAAPRLARPRARRRGPAVPVLRRSPRLRHGSSPARSSWSTRRRPRPTSSGWSRRLPPMSCPTGSTWSRCSRSARRRADRQPEHRRPRGGHGRQPHLDAEAPRAVRRGRGPLSRGRRTSSSACTGSIRARAAARHGHGATPARSTSRSTRRAWGTGSPSPATATIPSRSCARSTYSCMPNEAESFGRVAVEAMAARRLRGGRRLRRPAVRARRRSGRRARGPR